MIREFRPALILVVLLTVLTGLAAPLAMTGLLGLAFPFQAGGSLLEDHGKIIGSALIGQNFTAPGYFHPRLSATTEPDPKDASKTIPAPYAADNSNASNLAPTAKALIDRVKGDLAAAGPAPVPADAVTSSASGLDPDISPENARRQVARVARARHLPEARIADLVAAHTEKPFLGFIGEARVNVLALNRALDQLSAP
ncbi:MAG: potassium-transporting ATPase subunit KdpC [Acidibrevibacterium sp.]|jgi:K+-transporting ATPase ATPase C chain|uniref:potassium-transporting ATPase subunit KdpC n=1 Tax=Acidibrevibacterium fodinaquatile TaxID=1969806 RepID=UPI0023A87622|nr:potassium-transporting ATPase subunit KdpC [Acidibrevibacterium fodinaquatile]MCA7119688.1 potassium-transporting ATPase subunit KdpC [Acidibrevibacterium fodinaquatile]